MVVRTFLAGVGIFFAWNILDYFLHKLLLQGAYETTPHLWRPMNQLNLPLVFLVMSVLILCFLLIYTILVKEKTLASGIKFGALFGLAISLSAGFGTYIHMPIPVTLAWSWFLGGWIKAIVAGAIAGALIK